MEHESEVPREFESIYRMGQGLAQDTDAHFAAWPHEGGGELREGKLPSEFRANLEQIRDRAQRWFNLISLHVLPHTTYGRSHINVLMRRVVAATRLTKFYAEYHQVEIDNEWTGTGLNIKKQYITKHDFEEEVGIDEARSEAAGVIAAALELIRTATSPASAANVPLPQLTAGHSPNTAFILMWMDKMHPELVDVHETVKEVFLEFGIHARRADEIQHQDSITDLVLEQIKRSEFLFADLSGERPNVYYEIGYAHALGKRPILYRRADTPLHFDLSVHNVPGYANVTELRRMLRERLAAITGKTAMS